ncbi:MAG: ribonuclease P protein component [bacterium]
MEEKRERGGAAFPRSARLLSKRDYSAVFNGAKPLRNKYFTVLQGGNPSSHARLGLVVAKKKCRRAVDRHRLKRLVRESFRHNRDRLPSSDFIVITQANATHAKNTDLNKALLWFWNKISQSTSKKSGGSV